MRRAGKYARLTLRGFVTMTRIRRCVRTYRTDKGAVPEGLVLLPSASRVVRATMRLTTHLPWGRHGQRAVSLKRHNAKRDANEPEIVSALRSIGCDVFLIDLPVDLIVGYRGRTVLLEVKVPGARGRLTKGQKEFFETYRGEAYVVRTPERAIEVMTCPRRNP